MEEELIRAESLYLRSRVYEIRKKIQSLENMYDELHVKLKENLLIDGKIVEEELFCSIVQDTKKREEELTHIVIPMIQAKI